MNSFVNEEKGRQMGGNILCDLLTFLDSCSFGQIREYCCRFSDPVQYQFKTPNRTMVWALFRKQFLSCAVSNQGIG